MERKEIFVFKLLDLLARLNTCFAEQVNKIRLLEVIFVTEKLL